MAQPATQPHLRYSPAGSHLKRLKTLDKCRGSCTLTVELLPALEEYAMACSRRLFSFLLSTLGLIILLACGPAAAQTVLSTNFEDGMTDRWHRHDTDE